LQAGQAKLARIGKPALMFLMPVTLLGGCAPFAGVESSLPPVTVSEIIQLSKKDGARPMPSQQK
jgi:hypothetical protein